MKQFLDIDIAAINIKSMTELLRVRTLFIENYQQKFKTLDTLADSSSVIKHLTNYLKLTNIPTRNINQKLAMTLKYLPDDSKQKDLTRDDEVICLSKTALREANFPTIDVLELQQKIVEDRVRFNRLAYFDGAEFDEILQKRINEKNIIVPLHYKRDWKRSVNDIYATVCRKNLMMAFEQLRAIMDLSRTNQLLVKPHDYPVIISLQISHYIEILSYIDTAASKTSYFWFNDDIDKADIFRFRDVVERALQYSLKELKSLPEPVTEGAKSGCIPRMFFACVRRERHQQIFPEELLQPLIQLKKVR